MKELIEKLPKEKLVFVLGLMELMVKYPNQRIGQLIANYILPNCVDNDPFYIKDEKILEILVGELEKN